jgi:Uri superfamily endonuclease
LEFDPDAIAGLEGFNGYLYVGSTGKSVDERFEDNYRRKGSDKLWFGEVEKFGEDGFWKYNSPNSKRIRRHYFKHRPDLFYFDWNPIEVPANDLGIASRREVKLAEKLRNRGWKVEGPLPV